MDNPGCLKTHVGWKLIGSYKNSSYFQYCNLFELTLVFGKDHQKILCIKIVCQLKIQFALGIATDSMVKVLSVVSIMKVP